MHIPYTKHIGKGFFLFLSFVALYGITFGEEIDSIHFRSSRLKPQWSFKFRDAPADMHYNALFPIEALLENPWIKKKGMVPFPYEYTLFHISGLDTLEIAANWWIFTSVSDAEEKVLEIFCTTSGVYGNALDQGKSGEIGDNCWYGGIGGSWDDVWFIRNNVLVNIISEPYLSPVSHQWFFEFVKQIDELLRATGKIADAEEIPAPVITGAEVVSEGPNSETFITVKVYATDPRGQKLRFSFLGQPAGIGLSINGIINLPDPKAMGFSETIIWVSNEDHIVSKLERDFFTYSSVNDSEAGFTNIPYTFTLRQNTPNPFNPSTVIVFELTSPQPVRLAVYSATGQKVRELVSGHLNAGSHSVAWDGRNDAGQPVSSGVYLYRLEAGGWTEMRKMVLLR